MLIENGHVTAMTFAVLDTPKKASMAIMDMAARSSSFPLMEPPWIAICTTNIRRISLDGKEGVPAPVAEPGDDGIDRIHKVETPALELFPTSRKPARGTIMVCPGGGYSILAINHEGYFVAKKLNEFGYDAAILLYHVNVGKETRGLAIDDAKKALALLQKRGDDFGLSTRKAGVMGFSPAGILQRG